MLNPKSIRATLPADVVCRFGAKTTIWYSAFLPKANKPKLLLKPVRLCKRALMHTFRVHVSQEGRKR